MQPAGPPGDGGVAPPTISAPKGGGAIRGLGETFTPDPVTGAGTLTVPVPVPAGRSGFGPQLALRYDSGAGNGPFGLGWALPLPEIARRTDRGLPRYTDADVFLLTGAEELVPALLPDGAGWRVDETERDGHLVRRYRPRTEGTFARIERWTRRADGDVHWRSISRANVLAVYGLDAGSRVADPADPRRVFSWKICASYDDRGNAISYDYAAEDGAGVDPAAGSELPRVRAANRYLKRVRFGNRVPLLLDPGVPGMRAPALPAPADQATAGWMFELVLDYGEGHYRELPAGPDGEPPVAASPAPQAGWPARADPFSSYRAGFEVRTHRLCRRILTFHHFPAELGTADYLVRSLALGYRQTPTGSFLTSVAQSGHRRRPDGSYRTRSLPVLELDYAAGPLADPAADLPAELTVRTVAAAAVANLPAGVDGAGHRWVDLDGEGIPGALTEQADAWFYKPNLGGGRLGPQRRVATVPASTALDGGRSPLGGLQQLVDLAGDGNLDLVDFAPGAPGFYQRTGDGGWHRFRSFKSWPNRAWTDPNLRFVDLTGDGLVDVLVTEDACLTWHPGLAGAGFGPAVRVRTPVEERAGPRVVFADPAQSIHLADMSGDGLADLVRVRNGEVCYWPNLGYGRFGPKITMDGAPVLDRPEGFDQRRVRLADTDGTGPTDLVYLGRDRVRVYLNQSGNGWSPARVLPSLPTLDGTATVSVVDLLGRGTACLVWSSPLPHHARAPLRYLDLTAGRKPHLLVGVRNNLGAETVVTYAASTELMLADAAAGRPWITRLPFPVQVVTRVETYDRIGRSRFVTRASYHHGYFDPVEREFRGFARVDTLDTEEQGALTGAGAVPGGAVPGGDNLDAASHVPPVLTRSWYHTGVHLAGERVSRLLAAEYSGGPDSQLPDTVLPAGLSAEETRQACRALKGSLLRREVYARDGTPAAGRPYTVTEQNYRLRRLQPPRAGRPAVFLPHPGEALELHHERTAEPRVAHALTLGVDDFGTITLAAGVAYRRAAGDPSLPAAERAAQERTSVTFTVRTPTNPVSTPDAYRVPAVAETRTYQLLAPDPAGGARFAPEALRALIQAASDGAHDLPYHDLAGAGAAGGAPFRRLIEAERTLFRRNDLTGPLPLGTLESLALPGGSHRLALTAELATVRLVDPGRLPAAELAPALAEGGYLHSEGDPGWWVPSSQVGYSPAAGASPAQELAEAAAHFFLPRRYRDPFGHETIVDHDPHDLLPVRTRDPLGNLVSAGNDYRVLEPALVTDPNRNRTAAGFDTLGLVAGTATMGKPEEDLGDSLAGFDPDGTELGTATSRLVYDLSAYARTAAGPEPSPVVAQTLRRETHTSDLAAGQPPVVRRRYTYSDGFGREIQHKVEAEAGQWVTTGWTIFDNKGQPVREYEPFFDDTPEFRFRHLAGVSPITCYDPVGRVVARLHPDHSWEKLAIGPWRQQVWDRNDTVAAADPAADPDVGGYLARLPATAYTPTWAQARAGGGLGAVEQAAAVQTADHAGTPATRHLDPLGRTFLTVTHNRVRPPGGAPVDVPEPTQVVLDVEGNQLAVVDPEGRTSVRYEYDLAGHRVALASLDGGSRWTLADVAGRPVRGGDEAGHRFRTEYDPLRRPVRRFVTGTTAESDPDTSGREVLFEALDYGEEQPDPEARNLRTQLFRSRDGGGVVVMERYDFKGNLLATSQQLVAGHRAAPDWSQDPALAPEVFTNTTTFDALSRAVTVATPDGSVTRPRYGATGQLTGLDVESRGTSTGFVSGIDYDAQGRRTRIGYGNGAVTRHSYHPESQRLVRTTTTRVAVPDPAGSAMFSAPSLVQDLRYTYDPVGNLVHLTDPALRTVFHDGQQVEPVWRHTYDAAYRLVAATGREHVGQSALAPPGGWRDHPFTGAAALTDLSALRGYTERYRYDRVGNLDQVTHVAAGGGWTRSYHYGQPSPLEPGRTSNRLAGTSTGSPAVLEPYPHDRRGAVTSMPHLPLLRWDFRERLVASAAQAADSPEITYYGYSGGGQRVRKVTERPNGTRRAERLYLRGSEIYREFAGDGTTVTLARETLHVSAGEQPVALVDTEVSGGGGAPVRRFQLTDQLGSVAVELDAAAALISYEEYTPYGPAAFQAGRSAAEVSLKRYRYAGRERDEQTGLSYAGQRYLAPWLGRWISCDPAGPVDGPNLYEYARSNPVGYRDQTGTRAAPAQRVRDPLPEQAAGGGQERRAEQGTGERAPPDAGGAPPGAPPEPPSPEPDAQPGAGAGAAKPAKQASEAEEPPPESGPASQPASGPDQPPAVARPGEVDPATAPDPVPQLPSGPPARQSGTAEPAPGTPPGPDPATRPAASGEPTTPAAPPSQPTGPTLFGVPVLSAIMFAVTFLTFLAVMLLSFDQGVSEATWWVRGLVTGAWVAGTLYLGIQDIVTKTGDSNIDEMAFDRWSIIHGGFGVVAGLWGVPFSVVAVITVLWEVFEYAFHGFGQNESWWNRIVDVGVAWVGWVLFAGGVSLLDQRPLPVLAPNRESWARDRWLKLF